MKSSKSFLRIVPVVAGAILASGCSDIINVRTAQTEEEKARSAGAPSYEAAKDWPTNSTHKPFEKIEVASFNDAQEALLESKELIKKWEGYEARKRLRAIERFYEDDLRNVVNAKPLERWGKDSGVSGLEDNAVGFLGFMAQVYEAAHNSLPLEEERKRVFDGLVKAVTFGAIYEDCKKNGGKPYGEIRRRYVGLGTGLEEMLKAKLEGKKERVIEPIHFVSSNSMAGQNILEGSTEPVLRTSGLVAQGEKIYDKEDPAGISANSAKYVRGLQEKQKRFAQNNYKPNSSDFNYADPVSGRVFDSRAQVARVTRQF